MTISFPVGALIQGATARRDARRGAGAHPDGRPEVRHHRRSAAAAELFEARSPATRARWPRSPTISFGKETKGKIRLQITDPDGKVWEELVPKEKNEHPGHEGQVVNKGESIVDGPAGAAGHPAPAGVEELARYIVDEVQDVLPSAGVKINDKQHRGDRSPDAAPCRG